MIPIDAQTPRSTMHSLLASLPVTRRRLRAGEVLFHRGDPGEAAQVVLRGLVGLEINGGAREPLIALLLRDGDVAAAQRIVLPGTRHEVTARALTDCEVRLIRLAELEQAGVRGEAQQAMAEVIAQQQTLLFARLIDAAHLPAAGKVAGAVCRLAGDEEVAAVSQDVIAAVAGVVRATANAELRRLADRRVVRLGRREVTILDRALLERMCR